MKLNVHIDRLVMDAGQRLSREQLAEAIGRELGARIAAEGLPSQLRVSAMLASAPEPSGQPARTARPSGTGIGNAIYGSLQR